MDARHFDALARTVTEMGTRRGLLALLASLPFLGGLLALLDADVAAGRKNRRKTRKKPHKRAGRRRKKQKQRKGMKRRQCNAHSRARTCANRCGTVRNNCKKAVDCGSCVCEGGCEICQTCNDRTGVCEPDPSQQGDDCGQPGQVCQADGACTCDDSSCEDGQRCQGTVCVCDSGSCSGCCDEAGQCQAGTANGACGTGGVACLGCTGDDTCGGGAPGTPGVCGCTPSTCPAGANCGTIENVCGGEISCGGPCANPEPICIANVCTECTSNGQCGSGQVCCSGSCFTGVCCAPSDCTSIGNDCVNNQCQCGTGTACAGSTPTCCGDPGICVNTQIDTEHCGRCGNPCSGANPVCWNGECVCGDVCAAGCQFTSVQAAIGALPAGSTIRICAGAYGAIVINKDVTLIGVGDGSDPASNTLLDAADSGRVVVVVAGRTVSLQGLRITGGLAASHAGLQNNGTLTMTNCTVIQNRANELGGGGAGIGNDGSLTMTTCTVSLNDSAGLAGGIGNFGALTMTGCVVWKNNADQSGGGIVNGSGATVTLNGTSVNENTASFSPAGIDNAGTVNLNSGSTVSNNSPGNCGGSGTYNGVGCAA